MRLVVGSHNLMHGLQLDRLLPHYLELQRRVGLDVLCLQENRLAGKRMHAEVITDALGPDFTVACDAEIPGLAIVYDQTRLAATAHQLLALPRLAALNWFERMYIVGGAPEQKYAQVLQLSATDNRSLAVVNFHLDSSGDNRHRRAQVQCIADALRARNLATDAVVCGDTNAFAWPRRRQPAALASLLEPLGALGMGDDSRAPTHFFARQNEPKFTHRLAVAVGKLGLDIPLRYDVVYTAMAVVERGQTSTPASDHDLVWAVLAGN